MVRLWRCPACEYVVGTNDDYGPVPSQDCPKCGTAMQATPGRPPASRRFRRVRGAPAR